MLTAAIEHRDHCPHDRPGCEPPDACPEGHGSDGEHIEARLLDESTDIWRSNLIARQSATRPGTWSAVIGSDATMIAVTAPASPTERDERHRNADRRAQS